MKKLLIIASIVFLSLNSFPLPARQVVTAITYQTFYNELQPYGTWISYPQYGYVWQPGAGGNFRPYETNGHWVSTTDGWAWASDYNWGWAPFHYGRWLLDTTLGWIWIPGYEWAPAWVQWGHYNNYYGWAPLSPGININIGMNRRAPAGYWSFIPYNCIYRTNVHRYVVRNNVTINKITLINNYNTYNNNVYYHRGPDYKEVQSYTHTIINPIPIATVNRPGKTKVDNKLEVYRPQIEQPGAAKPVPERVKAFEEAKTDRHPAAIKVRNNNSMPVKNNGAVVKDGNIVIQPADSKPVGDKNDKTVSALESENTMKIKNNIKTQENAVKHEDIIRSQTEQNNTEQVKPLQQNNIDDKKIPAPDEIIIADLPKPRAADKFRHRDQPDARSGGSSAISEPVKKPIQGVQPVQQPQIRQQNIKMNKAERQINIVPKQNHSIQRSGRKA